MKSNRFFALVFCTVVFIVAQLVGCAAPTLLIEADHTSHPSVGWPIEPQSPNGHNVEVDITQASALLRWRKDGWYLDAGLGANLMGRDGGGFRGPVLTGTVRIGREIRLVKR